MEQVKIVFRESMRSLGGYFMAQIIMLGIIFVLYAIGLAVIGISQPVLKALGIALVDFIPVAGSGLVMVPWAIVALVQGKKNVALALAIVYVVIAVLRLVIEPIITGRQVGLNPLITVFATVVGSLVLGPVGIILGPIIAVVLTTIVRLNSLSTVQSNERAERRKRRNRR